MSDEISSEPVQLRLPLKREPITGGGHPVWSPEKVKILLELHAQGLTTSQIGEKLKTTRNAVIGKLHRLGICIPRAVRKIEGTMDVFRPRKTRDKGLTFRSRQPKAPKPARDVKKSSMTSNWLSGGGEQPKSIAEQHPTLESVPTRLVDIQDDQCHWPLDSGLYCGAPGKLGCLKYCEYHYKMSRRG